MFRAFPDKARAKLKLLLQHISSVIFLQLNEVTLPKSQNLDRYAHRNTKTHVIQNNSNSGAEKDFYKKLKDSLKFLLLKQPVTLIYKEEV